MGEAEEQETSWEEMCVRNFRAALPRKFHQSGPLNQTSTAIPPIDILIWENSPEALPLGEELQTTKKT